MNDKLSIFFDKLEDRTRARLSRSPIIYGFIGGIGVILFWRGVWHIADLAGLNPFLSLILGTVTLLVTGVFVSAFVGNRLIISGLNGEKKIAEKTEDEIKAESNQIKKIQSTLEKVEGEVATIQSEIKRHHHI